MSEKMACRIYKEKGSESSLSSLTLAPRTRARSAHTEHHYVYEKISCPQTLGIRMIPRVWGQGDSGIQLRLKIKSADGSFVAVTEGVSNDLFLLDKAPPSKLGEKFVATVRASDGKEVSVVLRTNAGGDGGRSNTVGVFHYLTGSDNKKN